MSIMRLLHLKPTAPTRHVPSVTKHCHLNSCLTFLYRTQQAAMLCVLNTDFHLLGGHADSARLAISQMKLQLFASSTLRLSQGGACLRCSHVQASRLSFWVRTT